MLGESELSSGGSEGCSKRRRPVVIFEEWEVFLG